ncbi:SDR family oxidoreductase [Terricaulis sp.]|uniref:SDR family oxidoreductase n=1 Tax=Terricaulis sp. TaxID=2768686 RepID=UPI00378380D8
MKRILIVGGAGVFGRRLAEGLRDTTDAELVIAGRSLARAEAAALAVRAFEAVVLDRMTATADDIRKLNVDLVIDAAGPFQGADLRFSRAVIEAGAHYLDLADARDFVAAFPSLDALARQNNVAAISGASSTPALTHAVLDELRAGWKRLDIIRAGIAPANQMDRGPAVMKAILTWVGAPVRVFEDGAWRERSGWDDCGKIDVPMLGRRRFALAETPDLDLLFTRYAPRDAALFMAGMEVWLMQRGMEAVSALRRWGVLREPARFSEFLRFCGDLLGPFGSDTGGMVVEAFGRDAEDRPVRARWSMLAPDGLGPFTPTFAALALARRFVKEGALPVGAHACVAMLRIEDFEPEFKRHNFKTKIDVTPLVSPFETALGADFATLPASVQAAHRGGPVTRLRGCARVEGPSSPLAEILANLFGLPPAADQVALQVTKRHLGEVETWTRDFGGRRMQSRLRALGPGRVRESFGPFHFEMAVSANTEGLRMKVVGWKLGPLPLPAFLAPRSTAIETGDGPGGYGFDVPIAAPILGRLTHYSGDLAMEEVEADAAPAARESA